MAELTEEYLDKLSKGENFMGNSEIYEALPLLVTEIRRLRMRNHYECRLCGNDNDLMIQICRGCFEELLMKSDQPAFPHLTIDEDRMVRCGSGMSYRQWLIGQAAPGRTPTQAFMWVKELLDISGQGTARG